MRTLSFIMVIMLFSPPFLTYAQQTGDAAQAIADAQRDAELVDNSIWAAAGCVFNVMGILLASMATPPVPVEKILGKSPEYVAYYTSTYQQTVKGEQTKSATTGCIIGIGMGVIGYLLLPAMIDNGFNI